MYPNRRRTHPITSFMRGAKAVAGVVLVIGGGLLDVAAIVSVLPGTTITGETFVMAFIAAYVGTMAIGAGLLMLQTPRRRTR